MLALLIYYKPLLTLLMLFSFPAVAHLARLKAVTPLQEKLGHEGHQTTWPVIEKPQEINKDHGVPC